MNLLFNNWQRKLIALITAILVWIFVNQSITETKTIPNVPVRVINLPTDKTIIGLLPNGFLSNRVSLTLSGSRDVVQQLEQGDLEVLLDVSVADSDLWVVQINKKNLVSLNPSFDLRHHINHVKHSEFVIKMSKLITEKIPVTVKRPTGDPPYGYEYLDIWPQHLTQTISGPKEEIQNLKLKGLHLTLDLNQISKEDLDALKHKKKRGHDDEISFLVPEKWKQVPIPFRQNVPQSINDPEAKNLRIDFLRKRLLPINKEVPVVVYYPIKHSDQINPKSHKLAQTESVRIKNAIPFFTEHLYVKDVSRQFLDVIRENIEIVVIAAPKSERENLQWSIEVIDPHEMEDTYVAYQMAEQSELNMQDIDPEKREAVLRKRFNDYMNKLSLFTEDGEPLSLFCTLDENHVIVKTIH